MVTWKIYKSGLYLGWVCSSANDYIFNARDFFSDKVHTGSQNVLPSPVLFDIADKLRHVSKVITRDSQAYQMSIDGTSYNRSSKDGMVLWCEETDREPVDLVELNDEVIALIAPHREHTVIVVRDGYQDYTPLRDWTQITYSDVNIQKLSVKIPMRDGISLATDIYLPDGLLAEGLPVILIRTPYDKNRLAKEEWRFVKLGYAVVVQDVRGRFESEGEWIPFHSEIDDGYDTLEYICHQKWCNGNIGMIGASYGGYVQWCAAASKHPSLKAMVSIVTAGAPFVDVPRRGGTFLAGFLAWGSAVSGKITRPELMVRDDWERIFTHRPIAEIPQITIGSNSSSFFNEWFKHEANDEFWQQGDWYSRGPSIQVPTLFIGGFFDDNIFGTMQGIDRLDGNGAQYRAILGAWGHNVNTRRRMQGFDFGRDCLRYDLDLQFIKWFQYHLKTDTGFQPLKKFEFYDFKENKWCKDESFPVTGSTETIFYLGRNTLDLVCAEDCMLEYTYDPVDPTPSLINPSENELNVIGDYSKVEKRADIISFTSSLFTQKTLVTGKPRVDFFAASNCRDTDFIVRLSIVTKDGKSIKISENMLRAKFKDGYEKISLLTPNEIYKFTMDLHIIGATIDKGESLRLTICSAAQNLVFANSNTGIDMAWDTDAKVATNSIYCGASFPSKIVLNLGGGIDADADQKTGGKFSQTLD